MITKGSIAMKLLSLVFLILTFSNFSYSAKKAKEDWKVKGESLYKANCLNCHGPTGKGDGPMAQSLNPKPRTFSDPTAFKNGATEAGIYKTLEEGLGTGMVSFKDTIKKSDRKALSKYVFETFVNKK